MTEWPEDRKNRCLSVSTNSAGLHFRERVQKIKKKQIKKKKKKKKKRKENRKSTKWAGRIWREKTRVDAHLGQNFNNIIISSNFCLKLL